MAMRIKFKKMQGRLPILKKKAECITGKEYLCLKLMLCLDVFMEMKEKVR